MSKILDESVTQTDQGTWDFVCPVTQGCGDPGVGPFTSTGWPTKKTARARAQEHADEHKGNGPVSELSAFRKAHGLTVDAAGVVTAEDI